MKNRFHTEFYQDFVALVVKAKTEKDGYIKTTLINKCYQYAYILRRYNQDKTLIAEVDKLIDSLYYDPEKEVHQ